MIPAPVDSTPSIGEHARRRQLRRALEDADVHVTRDALDRWPDLALTVEAVRATTPGCRGVDDGNGGRKLILR